jgi:hypothetical protein
MNIKEIAATISEDASFMQGPARIILKPLSGSNIFKDRVIQYKGIIQHFQDMHASEHVRSSLREYAPVAQKRYRDMLAKLQAAGNGEREMNVDAWAYHRGGVVAGAIPEISERRVMLKQQSTPGFREVSKISETWEVHYRYRKLFAAFKKWEIAQSVAKQEPEESEPQHNEIDLFNVDRFGEVMLGGHQSYIDNLQFVDYVRAEMPENLDLIMHRHDNNDLPLYRTVKRFKHIFYINKENIIRIIPKS